MRRETVPDGRSSNAKGTRANDKLDRATDRTLVEADRNALRELCRYSKLARYGGV